MKNKIFATAVVFALGLSACNNPSHKEAETQKGNSTQTKKTEKMNNLISIVEIPTTDFSRAVKFYQSILNVSIEEIDMAGTKMGILPNEEGTVNVCLVKGTDYKSTTDGTVVYLNAGDDLQPMLDKIQQHGGQIIVPKTEISPEMGYFALFIDTEGNKLGLHSIR